MKFSSVLFFALSLQLIAEDKTPKILDAHLAEYYRTQSNLLRLQITIKEAQSNLKDAEAELKTAIEALQKDCGDKSSPANDPKNPKAVVCLANPEPPPPAKK
jgi:hypothetical protein